MGHQICCIVGGRQGLDTRAYGDSMGVVTENLRGNMLVRGKVEAEHILQLRAHQTGRNI